MDKSSHQSSDLLRSLEFLNWGRQWHTSQNKQIKPNIWESGLFGWPRQQSPLSLVKSPVLYHIGV